MLLWRRRHRPRLKPQAITRRRALTKAKPRLCAAGRESAHPFAARAARGKSIQPEQGCVLCLRGLGGVHGERERRTAPLLMTREGAPDSVPHAVGHGGRGTGQHKDNRMGRALTAPRRSSRWRRARRSSCPGACRGRGRGLRAKATGYTQNFALQGQTCTLLRPHVRQVGEAQPSGESALKVARPRVLEPRPFG